MQIVMRKNGLGICRDTYKVSAAYVYIHIFISVYMYGHMESRA